MSISTEADEQLTKPDTSEDLTSSSSPERVTSRDFSDVRRRLSRHGRLRWLDLHLLALFFLRSLHHDIRGVVSVSVRRIRGAKTILRLRHPLLHVTGICHVHITRWLGGAGVEAACTARGECSSGASSSDSRNTVAANHAYEALLNILDYEGHTVRNGMIVLRAIDKIFTRWNELITAGVLDVGSYDKAAFSAVDPRSLGGEDSVYWLVAEALADLFDLIDYSAASLKGIQVGVQAMRTRIRRALDVEWTQNGKEMIIRQIETALIGLEHEFGMTEAALGVDLVTSAEPVVVERPVATRKRHARKSKAASPEWTDEQRLEVLKVCRDHPEMTHEQRTAIFNQRQPGVDRLRNGLRQELSRLFRVNTTIEQLEERLR